MNILIFGGSGFVGQHLARHLLESGHEVMIASRGSRPVRYGTLIPYETSRITDILNHFDKEYAIVNLAGESINSGRWTDERKQRILDSRVQLTSALVRAIEQANKKPSVLINASAVGYYGYSKTDICTEQSPAGKGFLADVTQAWEQAAVLAEDHTRVVRTRLGVVLGNDGGALGQMVLPYRLFVGGPIGSGKQWLSWIHVEDVAGIIQHCLVTPEVKGPVNVTAPTPVTMNEFGRITAQILHRPHWMPVPSFALRLLLGEMSEIILEGNRILPEKALATGYRFRFPGLEEALVHLLR